MCCKTHKSNFLTLRSNRCGNHRGSLVQVQKGEPREKHRKSGAFFLAFFFLHFIQSPRRVRGRAVEYRCLPKLLWFSKKMTLVREANKTFLHTSQREVVVLTRGATGNLISKFITNTANCCIIRPTEGSTDESFCGFRGLPLLTKIFTICIMIL